MKKKLAASDGLMSISGDELDENTDALSSTTTQSCAPSKRKARKETDDALLAGIEERGKNMMAFQQKMLEHLKPSSSDHERDAFVDWIRTVVNELEHNLWRRCQQDISSTLYRYIGENDKVKQQQSQVAIAQPIQFPHRPQFQPLQASSPSVCSSTSWQPPPSQWPTQLTSNVSPWQSQDPNWLSQQLIQSRQQTLTPLQTTRPVSAGSLMTGDWDGTPRTTTVSVSASPTTQGETSLTSQSSLHLSDLINMSTEPGLDDTQ